MGAGRFPRMKSAVNSHYERGQLAFWPYIPGEGGDPGQASRLEELLKGQPFEKGRRAK